MKRERAPVKDETESVFHGNGAPVAVMASAVEPAEAGLYAAYWATLSLPHDIARITDDIGRLDREHRAQTERLVELTEAVVAADRCREDRAQREIRQAEEQIIALAEQKVALAQQLRRRVDTVRDDAKAQLASLLT
jgi:hypothetical protein